MRTRRRMFQIMTLRPLQGRCVEGGSSADARADRTEECRSTAIDGRDHRLWPVAAQQPRLRVLHLRIKILPLTRKAVRAFFHEQHRQAPLRETSANRSATDTRTDDDNVPNLSGWISFHGRTCRATASPEMAVTTGAKTLRIALAAVLVI